MYTQLTKIYWKRCASCFIYLFLIQMISEKTMCRKKRFYKQFERCENIVTKILTYLVTLFTFSYLIMLEIIPFLSFLGDQKQESDLQQVGGLVTKYKSVFCFQWIALYFKSISYSIDVYKRIFLRFSWSHYSFMIKNMNLTGTYYHLKIELTG